MTRSADLTYQSRGHHAGLLGLCMVLLMVAAMLMGTGCSAAEDSQDTDGTAQAEELATQVDAPVESLVPSPLYVHFIDVGQGDSELVTLPDGKVMLIDAGGSSSGQTVVGYLRDQGVSRIDYLVASHPDEDHIGGMEDVLSAFDVGEVWMPNCSKDTETFNGLLDAIQAKGLAPRQAVAGATVADYGGYHIELLGPAAGLRSVDSNDYSAVVRLTYGQTTFLFPGDATAQEIVDDRPGHVDVLKAAHHGSETGTTPALVDALTPKYVVMSYAEGNSYGHPDQSVLDAIAGTTSYSTAANGNVVATSDGQTVTFRTDREGTIVAGVSAAERERQEREAQEAAAAQARAEAEAKAQQQETVYITPTGEKYHRLGCRTLSRTKNPIPISKQDAINQGYEACKVCNP